MTTHQCDLEKAKKAARDHYLRAKFREDEPLPIINKRFDAVALYTKRKLTEALEAHEGKVIYWTSPISVDI